MQARIKHVYAAILLVASFSITIQAQEIIGTTVSNQLIEPINPEMTDDLPEEVEETKEYISSLPEQLPEKPASNLWERTEILHDRL